MADIVVRCAFGFILVILYVVGEIAAAHAKQHTGLDLELNVLLPLLSLIFLDRFMQLFVHRTIGLRTRCQVDDRRLTIEVLFTYYGLGAVEVGILEVSGIQGMNAELSRIGAKKKEEEEEESNVPEDFKAVLTPTNPSVEVIIQCMFRDKPKPRMISIPLIGILYEVFRPEVKFRIGSKHQWKRPLVVRRVRRRKENA